jgi:hypothetical protein
LKKVSIFFNLRDQPMKKKVSDGRKNNGGAREGAGRKPGVPHGGLMRLLLRSNNSIMT